MILVLYAACSPSTKGRCWIRFAAYRRITALLASDRTLFQATIPKKACLSGNSIPFEAGFCIVATAGENLPTDTDSQILGTL